jgi:hypothetical protein
VSGIDVGQRINVGPGKFVKKNNVGPGKFSQRNANVQTYVDKKINLKLSVAHGKCKI